MRLFKCIECSERRVLVCYEAWNGVKAARCGWVGMDIIAALASAELSKPRLRFLPARTIYDNPVSGNISSVQ